MVQDGEVLAMKHAMCRGIAFILLTVLVTAGIPAAYAAPLQPYIYQHAFSGDHTLSGLFAGFTESFYAGDWAVEQAVLSMSYTVTQLALAELSTYTVTVNGQKIYTARVPAAGGEKLREQIALPPDTIKQGINYLTIETYIRTNDTQPCADDTSKANWMNVFKESAVTISYRPLAVVGSVASLYRQFSSIEALSNRQSAIVVDQDAAESALACAASALAGLAGSAQMFFEDIGLRVGQAGDLLFADMYQIYISRLDQLAGNILAMLTQEQVLAARDGIALILLNRDDRYMLAAVGADDQAMETLGRLLCNSACMGQMQSAWVSLHKDADVLTGTALGEPYLPLTESGAYVKGAFRQEAAFYIKLPKNRALAYDSRIRLIFRCAENLDFERSLVTVYVNDNPIGSKKLSQGMPGGDSLELSIPTDIKVSGSFTVRVAFDLEIKDLWCTLRQEETPWAYISSESMVKLNTVNVQGLLFDNYPGPFAWDERLNDMAVLLPANPSYADYEILRRMMLTIGRFVTDNSGTLRVIRGAGSLPDANVIAIGRYGVNQTAMDINRGLFFKFSQDGTTIDSNEKMRIEPGYGAGLASVQLLYAPDSGRRRALLVVSGVSDEAMLKAIPYIGSVEGLWRVYGDGFVADNEAAHSFRFKDDNAVMAPAAFVLMDRQDVLGLSLTAGGVLLLALFAFGMMVMKHRRRK